jgi:hypothetical protein
VNASGLRSYFAASAVLAALALPTGCARRRPVGSLEISPRESAAVASGCTPLRFTFRPEAALDRVRGRPTVFVHVRGESARLVGELDHPLPKPWDPGVVQSYEIPLCPATFDPPLAPGRYRITAGLYDDSWGYRWPLETGGAEELDTREYFLARVAVGPG